VLDTTYPLNIYMI